MVLVKNVFAVRRLLNCLNDYHNGRCFLYFRVERISMDVGDANLNSLPADSEIDQQSYAVPIQQTDTSFPALVLLSDFPTMALEFRKCTGELISSPSLVATSSSIVNQTFLQYLSTVNFGTFPVGRCYGRISYDSNLPGRINASLTECLSPFIDGDLAIDVDAVNVATLLFRVYSFPCSFV